MSAVFLIFCILCGVFSTVQASAGRVMQFVSQYHDITESETDFTGVTSFINERKVQSSPLVIAVQWHTFDTSPLLQLPMSLLGPISTTVLMYLFCRVSGNAMLHTDPLQHNCQVKAASKHQLVSGGVAHSFCLWV